MESNTKSGGTNETGTSSKTLHSDEESAGETYEKYPGAPAFAKGVVPEFEDVPEDKRKESIRGERYSEIEKLIIQWNNDGTKTAGTLARRICLYLDDEWLKFQKAFYE